MNTIPDRSAVPETRDPKPEMRYAAALPDRPADAPRLGAADDDTVARFLVDAARLMRDLHCTDIIIFDVRGLSDVTNYVMIATGTSDRQIQSVARDVEALAKQSDMERYGREADAPKNWLLIDLIEVIVNLFERFTREHYDLEMLWGDAPRIAWELPNTNGTQR